MSLQDKLDQAKKDKKQAIITFDKEINAIKTQIAERQVVYTVGDEFMSCGDKFILVQFACNEIALVMIDGWDKGNRWAGTVSVASCRKITSKEFDRLTGERNASGFIKI